MALPSFPNQVDITGQLKGQVTVTPEEHPDERVVRLRREERQGFIEQNKGIAVFVVVLIAVIIIGVGAGYELLFDSTASAETKKLAQTVISGLFFGSMGFIVGKKVGSE